MGTGHGLEQSRHSGRGFLRGGAVERRGTAPALALGGCRRCPRRGGVAGGVAVAGNMGPRTRPARRRESMAPTASAALTTTPSPAVATSVPVPRRLRHPPRPRRPRRHLPRASGDFHQRRRKGQLRLPGLMECLHSRRGRRFRGCDVDVFDEAGCGGRIPTTGPAGGVGGACRAPFPIRCWIRPKSTCPYQPSGVGHATVCLPGTPGNGPRHGVLRTDQYAGRAGRQPPACTTCRRPRRDANVHFRGRLPGPCRGPGEIPGRRVPSFPSMAEARHYMQTPEYVKPRP